MDIKIKKLTSDLIDDYLHFFDTERHSDNKDEHKCYCVCWCSDDHRTSIDKMSTAQKRREVAKQYIYNEMIKGYLAYSDSKVVGWCNANKKSNCYNCISWLKFMKEVDASDDNYKVKSIFCFTIASNMRRKGIATKLLERVCSDAKAGAFDFVEAYPRKELKQIDDFEGHIEMYRKNGFYIYKELDEFYVVRKNL